MPAIRRSPFATTGRGPAKSLDELTGRLLDDRELRQRYPRLASWLEASRAERLARLEMLRQLARTRSDWPPETRRQLADVSRLLESLRSPEHGDRSRPGLSEFEHAGLEHARPEHFDSGDFGPGDFGPGYFDQGYFDPGYVEPGNRQHGTE